RPGTLVYPVVVSYTIANVTEPLRFYAASLYNFSEDQQSTNHFVKEWKKKSGKVENGEKHNTVQLAQITEKTWRLNGIDGMMPY
ncbi:hypothetical protein PENTCL1PPCAC_25528, partial [Pristionchus entomophagus]